MSLGHQGGNTSGAQKSEESEEEKPLEATSPEEEKPAIDAAEDQSTGSKEQELGPLPPLSRRRTPSPAVDDPDKRPHFPSSKPVLGAIGSAPLTNGEQPRSAADKSGPHGGVDDMAAQLARRAELALSHIGDQLPQTPEDAMKAGQQVFDRTLTLLSHASAPAQVPHHESRGHGHGHEHGHEHGHDHRDQAQGEEHVKRDPEQGEAGNEEGAATDETGTGEESEAEGAGTQHNKCIHDTGVIVMVLSALLLFAAFGFANLSLLAALGSVQFVSNAVFAWLVLGYPVTTRIAMATTTIVVGDILVILSSSHESKSYTAKELMHHYENIDYIVSSPFPSFTPSL